MMNELPSHHFPDGFLAPNRDTLPGSPEEIQWEIVAQTPGLIPAQIIAGRLQTEGIPTRAWQEAAGQAIGLTVGLLGTGYVAVPVEMAEQALAILNEIPDESDSWDEVEADELEMDEL